MDKVKLRNSLIQFINKIGWEDYWEIPIQKRLEIIKQYYVKLYGRL